MRRHDWIALGAANVVVVMRDAQYLDLDFFCSDDGYPLRQTDIDDAQALLVCYVFTCHYITGTDALSN